MLDRDCRYGSLAVLFVQTVFNLNTYTENSWCRNNFFYSV